MPCSRLLAFGLVLAPLLALGCRCLQSTGRLLVCRSFEKVLSLAGALSRAAEIGVEQGTSIGEGLEKEVTMAGILVSMSVAMSWSGFVALVHDHRVLQGSFAVSLRTPKAPLRVVRAERHLVGLEEHRA